MIENEIITAEQELIDAILGNNIYLLNQLLHEHFLFNTPDGNSITKSMAVGAYSSGNMTVEEALTSGREINNIDDTAVVVVNVDLTATFRNQTIHGRYRFLNVWKQLGEEWKMIGGSCVPVAGNILEDAKLS